MAGVVAFGLRTCRGFPRGTFCGVSIIRIIVSWVCTGVPVLRGSYHEGLAECLGLQGCVDWQGQPQQIQQGQVSLLARTALGRHKSVL